METSTARAIHDPAAEFYIDAVRKLQDSGIPFLVGGAFAFSHYSRVPRDTKDIDVFVRPEDCPRVLEAFDRMGYETEVPFPHWLGKIHKGDYFMDVIFNSGNGVARVDDLWFDHAPRTNVLGLIVRLSPAEEMIWSKAFIQERERFDGADVNHLLREVGPSLDWPRLLMRFGDYWRVLLSHLIMFGFVYPDKRQNIPAWVTDELLRRLRVSRGDGLGWNFGIVGNCGSGRTGRGSLQAVEHLGEKGRRLRLATRRRHFSSLVFVLGVATGATRLLYFVIDHRHDGMVGYATFARTVIVQDVAGPIPAFLHAVPPKNLSPPTSANRTT